MERVHSDQCNLLQTEVSYFKEITHGASDMAQ